MADLNIVVAGASGRMGRALIREIAQARDLVLSGALEAEGHPDLGRDAGLVAGLAANGVTLTADPLPLVAQARAVIDFTQPMVSVMLAGLAAQARTVQVIGTTGFSPEQEARIGAAARHAVIVKSGNMSMGVTLLAALVERAAKALPGYDVEILEMHHRMKVDAPSGTALLLGRAAAKGRGTSLDKAALPGRQRETGPRVDGGIGFASLRGGSVVGEHQVFLAGAGERLALSHSAEDRSIFARGALEAARWGQARKPGLYAMTDVLGL
ncbi:MAG: 4-hydroxy-tetrahydrodipicolinate reductase [Rhizomicrobium sp.]